MEKLRKGDIRRRGLKKVEKDEIEDLRIIKIGWINEWEMEIKMKLKIRDIKEGEIKRKEKREKNGKKRKRVVDKKDGKGK